MRRACLTATVLFILCGCGSSSTPAAGRWNQAQWYEWLMKNPTVEETAAVIRAGLPAADEARAYQIYAEKHDLRTDVLGPRGKAEAIKEYILNRLAADYAAREQKLADDGGSGDLQTEVLQQAADEHEEKAAAQQFSREIRQQQTDWNNARAAEQRAAERGAAEAKTRALKEKIEAQRQKQEEGQRRR